VVTVTSSAALAFAPVVTIGQRGSLLAVSGSAVVYQTEDGIAHLHVDTTDTVLDTSAVMQFYDWMLSNTDAVAIGADATGLHLYHWTPDGVRHDLGLLGSDDTQVRIRSVVAPWVLAEDGPAFAFFNLADGTSVVPSLNNPDPLLPAPNTNGQLLIPSPQFYLAPGGLALYYLSLPPTGIYRWDQSTNQSQQVSITDVEAITVQTDGSRAAWLTPPTNPSQQFGLAALDINSNTLQTVSTGILQFQLADGLLVWTEYLLNTDTIAIKVSDGTTVSTAVAGIQLLYGTGGGHVLYGVGQLYAWSAAHGSQLLMDIQPGQARIAQSTAYFTNGVQQTLYAVPLN
jgi:hypothetical protein